MVVKRFYMIAALLLLSGTIWSQMIEWALFDTPEVSVDAFNGGMIRLWENRHYGLMNHEGKTLLEPIYDWVDTKGDGIAVVKNAEKIYGAMNYEGKWILDMAYANISKYGYVLAVKDMNGKHALYGLDGKQILPFEHEISEVSHFPLLSITFDDKSKLLYSYKTDSVYSYRNARSLGTYYLIDDSICIDKYGQEIPYESLCQSSAKARVSKQGDKFILVKPNGDSVPLSYLISSYADDYLLDMGDSGVRFYDKYGELVSNEVYKMVLVNVNGALTYTTSPEFSTWGLLDRNGKILYKEKCSFIENPTADIALLSVNNKQLVYSLDLNKVLNEYAEVREFNEGLARVKSLDGKYGFINEKGKEVVRADFDDAGDFREGLALVKRKGESYYIDNKGNVAIGKSPFVRYLGSFGDGVALVRDENTNKYGFIYNPFLSENERYSFNHLSPGLAEIYQYQGDYEMSNKDYEKAGNYYIKSIQCDSCVSSVWNDLGVCFDHLDNTEYAMVCFEEAYRLDGNLTAKKNIEVLNARSSSESENNSASDNNWADLLMGLGNSLINLGNSLGNGGMTNNYQSGNNVYMGTGTPMPATGYYPSDINNNTSDSESSSGRDLAYYQRLYDGWERRAKECYELLTNSGYRTMDEDGKMKGGSTVRSQYVRRQQLLREAQREMQKVRSEALRDGITLVKSQYEDASVSLY